MTPDGPEGTPDIAHVGVVQNGAFPMQLRVRADIGTAGCANQ
jgi:hypothetical protein